MNPNIEVALRTIIAFTVLFLISRLLGKKLISQMTYFDYVAGITLGSLTANTAMDYKSNFATYLLALTTWASLSFTLGYLALKYRGFRKVVEGEPTLLVQNGQILEENMRKIHFNTDDLLALLRQKKVFQVSDVEFALLEPDGKISVLLKSQNRPITPQDLNIQTQYEGLPSELIMDGQIIYPNLTQNGLDVNWLQAQLEASNVNSVDDVILAQLRTDGTLYIDVKSDKFPTYNDISDKE